jgi:photosystem II stability/assembly factor-like uncharacterized protein
MKIAPFALLLLFLASCGPTYSIGHYDYDSTSTASIAVSPADADTVITVHEHAFERSTTGGSTWGVLGSPPASVSLGIEAFDTVASTASPSVFYATGIGSIWKSTDGGVTFASITPALPPHGQTPLLAVDGADARHAVACSTDDGALSLFLTTDGGTSWIPASIAGVTSHDFVTAIAIEPGSPNVYGVLQGNVIGTFFGSLDGGRTYAPIARLPGTLASTSFVLATPGTVFLPGDRSVYRSTDQGLTWTVVPLGGYSGCYAMAPSPANPLTVYAVSDGLYRSTDGGRTFALLSRISVTAKVIAISPANAQVIYVGGDSIQRSDDGGATFSPLPVYDYAPRIFINI